MLWQVQFFPPCTHHVFLSHCREDREPLVFPLYSALQRRGLAPWLDRHDYPYGRASFGALRDEVLKSRHTVFLVTPAMLAQPRGWGVLELAWAHLLQENLAAPGGVDQNILLPLFFVQRAGGRLSRSVWQPVRERGPFHRPGDGDPIAWAARQIFEFVLREEKRGLDIVKWLREDSRARSRLAKRPGLIDRITCRHPASILPD